LTTALAVAFSLSPSTLRPQDGCLRRTRAVGPVGMYSLKMKGSVAGGPAQLGPDLVPQVVGQVGVHPDDGQRRRQEHVLPPTRVTVHLLLLSLGGHLTEPLVPVGRAQHTPTGVGL
jgi:hypothetical protein